MTISKDIQSLERHLAQYGLHAVAMEASEGEPEVFRIHFLNKIELAQWEKQQQLLKRKGRKS